MKVAGVSFYFVLYIVAIVTVFVITMERDHLLKERDEDIAHLVELHLKPIELSPYEDTVKFFIDPDKLATIEPITLRARVDGPIEKEDVRFSVVKVWRSDAVNTTEEDPGTAAVSNVSGDAVLSYAQAREGIYIFQLAAHKERVVREGSTMKVTIRDTSYSIPYSGMLESIDRDTTLMMALVEKSGINPLQLTMNVQEREENWILGPPFRKKIFVGGIEDIARATFSGQDPAHIERDGDSYVTLVWDRPSLGTQRFVVRGNAARGLGEKDISSVDFSVTVVPPKFISQPGAKGFWGVPYIFDGTISGINPLDLSVAASHDGVTIGLPAVAGRDTVIPQKEWNALEFSVLYHGFPIKEHRVAITAPPPPQIRWLRQDIDRPNNLFTVSVSASDAINGPVRMSLEAQPSGIARIDKIRGTSFNIAVSLQTKPSAVFLKLTATDQYGGQAVSTKQFNIPE